MIIHTYALIPRPNNRTNISGPCIQTEALLSIHLDQFSCQESKFDLKDGAGFPYHLGGHPDGEVIPGPRSSMRHGSSQHPSCLLLCWRRNRPFCFALVSPTWVNCNLPLSSTYIKSLLSLFICPIFLSKDFLSLSV